MESNMAVRIVLGVGFALAACGSPDGEEAGSGGEDETAAAAVEVASEPFEQTGRWVGETSTGTPVTVTTPDPPVRAGPLTLHIEVANSGGEALPVTVDLVAPEMPMHGIMRFEAEARSPEEYVAELDVPMAGLWMVYVNLDIGVNAASFEFRIPESGEEADHQHP